MSTSYNGWPASQNKAALGVARLSIGGVEFVGGVKDGDVLTVLGHVAAQFHQRVEALRSPGCWGYAYRMNRNANNLSCHSSATAIDCNAPQHPNGIEASKNFSKGQIAEIHEILAEVPELAEVVHWGGDWHAKDGLTPDPMHFEIHDHDLAKLARVAARIRALEVDPMKALLRDLRAVTDKHGVSGLYGARVLLWGATGASSGLRRAAVIRARALLKPFK